MTNPANEKMQLIDLDGRPLREVDPAEVTSKYATLFRNASLDLDDFRDFAKAFGYPLMYGDDMLMTFDKVHQENELHYDGISSREARKIPGWLLFYVEECPDPRSFGGEFLLMDCVGAMEALPAELVDFLRGHKEEFYGYPMYDRRDIGPREFAFAIDPITSHAGKDRLRVHLPTEQSATLTEDGELVYSKAHNFSLKFNGASAAETLRVFDELRTHLMKPELVWEIPLQARDVLVVNNEYVFHGRNPVTRPMSRLMHRAQMLPRPLD